MFNGVMVGPGSYSAKVRLGEKKLRPSVWSVLVLLLPLLPEIYLLKAALAFWRDRERKHTYAYVCMYVCLAGHSVR